MNEKRTWKLLVALAVTVLLSQGMYAQATAFHVVPEGSVALGYDRPHSMIVASAPNSPFAFVHGPGQPVCNSTSSCYYFPADLRQAYTANFISSGNGGVGITVGIADAFYNSQTEADLGVFSSQFGLPACTIANSCLTIVSQTGGPPTAGFNQGWAQETNLDVQWVHAMAPNARILLVTATNNSSTNLYAAVQYAAAHSDVVSNSFGHTHNSADPTFDPIFFASTVPILFSSGDTGAVTTYPCASPYVTCVGGTNLTTTSATYRNLESAWSGSGGGCSAFEAAQPYQSGFSTSICGTSRGVPDIAALADPFSGALTYLGTNAGGTAGFYVFGGTSLASPVMAAIIANIDASRVAAGKAKLGANLSQLLYQAAANPYFRYRYYDVTAGSSGFPAVTGWDRATGLGVTLNPALTAYLDSLP